PNVPVTFKIFTSTTDSSKALATLTDKSDDMGIASPQWTVKYDPARQDDPRLIFEATAGGGTATSPVLLVCDFAEATLTGDNVELKATVKRDGKDEGAQPNFTASGSPTATITPAVMGEKGTAAMPASLNVGQDEGDVSAIAEFMGTKASVKVKVVRSVVSR